MLALVRQPVERDHLRVDGDAAEPQRDPDPTPHPRHAHSLTPVDLPEIDPTRTENSGSRMDIPGGFEPW